MTDGAEVAEVANGVGPPLAQFVGLLGSLTSDFDVNEVLQQTFEHAHAAMPVSGVAVVLGDAAGRPGVVSMDQPNETLEVLQLDTDEGPCLECFRTGRPVVAPDLSEAPARWHQWSQGAISQGFRSAYSTPMVDRSRTVGALNLFAGQPHALRGEDLVIAQALAYLATLAVVTRRDGQLVDQLQRALDSRVVIEQAKGILSRHVDLDMNAAFQLLRRLARTTNIKLLTVAERVVDGSVSAEEMLAAFGRPDSRIDSRVADTGRAPADRD